MNSEAGGWNTCQDVKSPSSERSSPVDALIAHTPSSVSSSRRSSLSGCSSDNVAAYNPTPRSNSSGRSSRRKDKNKIPRPRNAFIVFRCEYCQRHAMENKGSERPPTPEKTLSQRAGALWQTMDKEARRPYVDKAEIERIAHQLTYPDYKYRPNRKGLPRRRASGSVSRREQVEMLMKASAERSQHDSGSECDSPVSLSSSSPGPGDRAQTSCLEPYILAHRRSMSLPHLNSDPYPFAHTYFLEPTSCVSSPGGGPQRTARRVVSASRRQLSSSIPPPDLGFELDYGPGTVPFVYHPGQSSTSTMSLEEINRDSFAVSPHDLSPILPISPISPASQVASSLEPSTQEYFPSQSSTLYHRRQRSNTAPSTLSPLTVISSSLHNWGREASDPSVIREQAELPSFTFTSDTSSMMTPTSSTIPVPMSHANGEQLGTVVPFMSGENDLLLTSTTSIDMDRTPRRADFPFNIQQEYASHFSSATSSIAATYSHVARDDTNLSMASYDLESYMAGLDSLSITPAPYDMSPFQNVDFDDFIYIGHD